MADLVPAEENIYVTTDLRKILLLAFWSRNKAECFGNGVPERSIPRCMEKQHGWRRCWWKSGPHYANETLNKRNGGRTEACRYQEVPVRGRQNGPRPASWMLRDRSDPDEGVLTGVTGLVFRFWFQ